MVRILRVGILGLLALLKCTSATKIDPPEPERKYPESCVADDKVYRTGHSFRIRDANYLVMCDRGNTGSEIATHRISRGGFAACVDHCERREDCDGFLFDGDRQAGICYLKGHIGSYTKTEGFVTCSKDPDGNGEKPLPLDGSPAGTAEGPVTRRASSTSGLARATSPSSTPAPPRFSPTSSSGPASAGRSAFRTTSSSRLPPWSPMPSSSSTSSRPAPPRSSPSSSTSISSSKLPPWSPFPSSSTTSSDAVPPRYSPSSTFITSTYASIAASSTPSDHVPPPATTSKTSDLQTFTLTPTPSPISQCPQAVNAYGDIYHGGNGSAYQFTCGIDHYGGDLTHVGSDTFLGCVDACDQNPDCIGYAYTTGNCWLKKYLRPSKINTNVDFVLNLERLKNAKPEPPTTLISVPTTTPTPATGSCPILAAGNATSAIVNTNGMRYNIECGTDRNGGDLVRADGRTFLECSVICDATDKCIGFAWVGGNGPGNCYLKSTVTNSGSDPNVDYAHKDAPSKLPPTSVSSLLVTDRLSTSLMTPVPTSSKAPEPTYPPRPTSTESKVPMPNPSTVSLSKVSASPIRTETEYISKTYTQTQWVGSTANGGLKTTSKPTTPAAASTARPEPSKRPEDPPRPGDKDLCKSISSQKAKKLRVEVTDGDRRYHGMYLKDPPSSKLLRPTRHFFVDILLTS